jgi:hypothetical protein
MSLSYALEGSHVRTLQPITNPNLQVTTQGREVISEVIKTGTMNSVMMKLSVRISDLDWARLISERTQIRAIPKTTLEDLSRDERKAIRKLIESLLKGGEELEKVREADHATANGMMQQVIVILEGLLEKPESVATGWVKDFDSAKVKIVSYLVEGLRGYLNADHSEKDSEADTEVSDSTAAGMDNSLQGEPPQGEVTEKDVQELFVFEEEKIGILSDKEKAPFEVAEQKTDMEGQTGNTGNGAGAPTDEKRPSPYLAHATSPSLPPRLPHLTLVVLRNQPASMVTLVL